MSASLTWALTSGADRSVRVTNALLVPLLVVLAELVELDPVGPPLIHWPTAPLMLAIVPSVGAVSTAAARLFWARVRAARALSTWAWATAISCWVAGAAVPAALAC